MSGNSTLGFERDQNGDELTSTDSDRLERLCKSSGDGILVAPAETGIERIEARFQGNGFSPHRHDTYAIGLTMAGVQTFSYRGEKRASMPGQVIVIHPDEEHDGGAGTREGLRYRMLYVAPERIAETLSAAGYAELPYVPAPVVSDLRFRRDLADALSDIDQQLGNLKRECLIADLANCLTRHSDRGERSSRMLDWPSLKSCAEFLRENCSDMIRIEALEGLTDMDRFTLSRQFRKVHGTSPHRFLVMRRLDRAKAKLVEGAALAEVAIDSGFADQSHMTRHFKKAYGMTPGQWRQLAGQPAG
ncbi:AraC family transcriptional regulator [Roseibium sp.]|uniref:AraC family transcriptional regulator n=1 Tax=Roseibium sp. TaxID=1936156 RepID=UPI003BAFE4C2